MSHHRSSLPDCTPLAALTMELLTPFRHREKCPTAQSFIQWGWASQLYPVQAVYNLVTVR